MRYFILLFFSVISLNCFANIQSYYPINVGRIATSAYIKANQNSEVYLKGTPSFFFVDRSVYYNDIDKTPNNFELTLLDASKLDDAILFLSLSHLEVVNINFINITENHTNEIYFEFMERYNTSDYIKNHLNEPLVVNIKGLKCKKFALFSDRDLVINFSDSKINSSLISTPKEFVINEPSVTNHLDYIKYSEIR